MARQVLQQDKRALMLTQTPGKLMMSLSLPAIVGMAVIGLYTFMDAVLSGWRPWEPWPWPTRSRSSIPAALR